MFDSIAAALQGAFSRFRAKGLLTEANIEEGLREVRTALLEADVHFKVARDFIRSVKTRAVGRDVLASIHPAQQIVKIVHDELVALLGPEAFSLPLASQGPTVVLLVGLQGSGKTTTAVKLARWFRKRGQRPIVVAADLRRPAAMDQLQTLAEREGVPCYREETGKRAPAVCRRAVREAETTNANVVILDSAGRLHVDDELMGELEDIRRATDPAHVLLVCDALTGQDAVSSARVFHERAGVTGIVLTKLDGDSRGGAALSLKAVTGCPIRFAGTGERLDALEPFHPERMASRILGMGDVVSLVEKAEETIDQEKAEASVRRLLEDRFTMVDFLEQIRAMRRMGPLQDLLSRMPGLGGLDAQTLELGEGYFSRIESIILSMTPGERLHPEILDHSRRRRIARGSGRRVEDVNELLKGFKQMRKMAKNLRKLGALGGMGGGRAAKRAKRELARKMRGRLPDLGLGTGPGNA